jgi:hypothetical protein
MMFEMFMAMLMLVSVFVVVVSVMPMLVLMGMLVLAIMVVTMLVVLFVIVRMLMTMSVVVIVSVIPLVSVVMFVLLFVFVFVTVVVAMFVILFVVMFVIAVMGVFVMVLVLVLTAMLMTMLVAATVLVDVFVPVVVSMFVIMTVVLFVFVDVFLFVVVLVDVFVFVVMHFFLPFGLRKTVGSLEQICTSFGLFVVLPRTIIFVFVVIFDLSVVHIVQDSPFAVVEFLGRYYFVVADHRVCYVVRSAVQVLEVVVVGRWKVLEVTGIFGLKYCDTSHCSDEEELDQKHTRFSLKKSNSCIEHH